MKNYFHGPFYNQYYMESGNCRLTLKTTHYLSHCKQQVLVTFQRNRMLWLWWSFFLQFWQWGCAVLDLPVLLHTVLITPCPHLLSFVHDGGMASYSDLAVFLTLLFGSQEDVQFLHPLDIPLAPQATLSLFFFFHRNIWKEEPIIMTFTFSPSIHSWLNFTQACAPSLPEIDLAELS